MKRMLRRPLELLRAGFTLLEILIAIVVLVVGITGIVALFPTAIKSGNQTVVDSYASLITQSVVDAINVGMREARYQYTANVGAGAENWEYFIFDHDGIQDDLNQAGVVPENYLTVYNKDFCILLPRGNPTNTDPLQEMVLHHPCPPGKDGTRNNPQIGGAGAPINDERDADLRPTASGDDQIIEVRRVYQLGRDNTSTANPRPIRPEFLGEAIAASGSSSTGGERKVVDPYPQYGFHFSITRAKIDTNVPRGVLDNADLFSDNLFAVSVKIFRNFNPDAVTQSSTGRVQKTNLWIHEFVTLISK